jgi:CheY-like chemotaxis protein
MKNLLLKPFRTSRDLESYFTDRVAAREIRDRRQAVRIAVVDDHPFAPQANLNAYNYNITQIGDVRSVDQVKGYDLVLCDIIGVGLSFSQTLQGASLMAEIKRVYPEKLVIAYTGATLNQSATKEAKLVADALIKKDIDIKEWVDKLDNYINLVLNPQTAWSRVRADLVSRGVGTKDILLLEDAFVGSMLSDRPTPRSLATTLDRTKLSGDARNIVTGLISSAIYSFVAGS